MPLVYSEAAGAFVEAETPHVSVGGVFCDSIGRIYQGDAWQDIWPTKLWLYQDGDECSKVTGGWLFANQYPDKVNWFDCIVAGDSATRKKNVDSIYLQINASAGSTTQASIYTKNKIEVKNYSKIHIRADFSCSTRDGAQIHCFGYSVPPNNTGIYANKIAGFGGAAEGFKGIGAAGASYKDKLYTLSIDRKSTRLNSSH